MTTRTKAKAPRAAPATSRPVDDPGRRAARTVAKAREAGVQALQEELGYVFLQPELLELALTHSSYIYEARLGRARAQGDTPNQPGTDNEQMEFLGDAVLGLAVTELLLQHFPERSEGELTRIRAALVSRKRMAEFGTQLALGPLLRMGRSAELVEGRSKPAVLANTAEAVLGAMYLDVMRGPDLRARGGERALRLVRGLLERLVVTPDLPALQAELARETGRGGLRDAKSRLQEQVQAERAGRLFYADVDEQGPAHARLFRVEARLEGSNGTFRSLAVAEGASKKEAQQRAATIALEHWQPAGEPARTRPVVAPPSPTAAHLDQEVAHSQALHAPTKSPRAKSRVTRGKKA